MRPSPTLLAVLVAPLLASSAARAQPRQASLSAAPAARWIADGASSGSAFGVYHFRRALDLDAPPARFIVHVSADNRYRLLVNGREASVGPQRSDLMHWKYETVDLAPFLHAGRNVIAATVWNWGAQRPVGQLSRRTAFLLQADAPADSLASTGRPGWRVLRDSAYAPLPVVWPASGGYYAAPPGEMVDAARYPWGWEDAAYADTAAAWHAALSLEPAQPRGADVYGLVSTWQLEPRSIPALEETPVRFARVRRQSGLAAGDAPLDDGVLRGASDLVVPAHARASLVLDQGALTTAYLELVTSGGAGATVSATYAEAPRDASGAKGNRDDLDGKTFVGVRDEFRPDGGARRAFRTLWWRAYRYVQLDVETGDAPLRVHDVRGTFTAYPYAERARFASDDAGLDAVWRMSWRTARACANETFFDTPYYEQLQYVGDTRIQGLLSLYVAGDDRLVRNALVQFDRSRVPEGLTASRYPADLPQYIPPFSLVYVAMVHDYWMLRDDPAFVRALLPGTRGVLDWFAARVDATGMVAGGPWWGFVDWTDAWERGAPPGAEARGHSTPVTLLYAYALDRAAGLEDSLGMPALAADYRRRADRLRAAVRRLAWDPARGLFRDSPDSARFGQQTNALAVLAGGLPAAERRRLAERLVADTTLVPASYYFRFYLHEALRDAGLGDRYLDQLAPWRRMLAMGLTTTPEAPEPTRSDSHAWSAHPLHGLLATVLGVRPAAPGFRRVLVEPHLGRLTSAEGAVPHPRGDVAVRLTRVGASGLRAEITLPPGTPGVLAWGGRRVALHAGRQVVSLQ